MDGMADPTPARLVKVGMIVGVCGSIFTLSCVIERHQRERAARRAMELCPVVVKSTEVLDEHDELVTVQPGSDQTYLDGTERYVVRGWHDGSMYL